jgi:endonuclease YncB( thermonuclease family)
MTVGEVVDGDMFQLASGKRFRLMGVDAPEYTKKTRICNLFFQYPPI